MGRTTVQFMLWRYRETPSDLVPIGPMEPRNFDTFEAARADVRTGELVRIVREMFFGTHETYLELYVSPEYIAAKKRVDAQMTFYCNECGEPYETQNEFRCICNSCAKEMGIPLESAENPYPGMLSDYGPASQDDREAQG